MLVIILIMTDIHIMPVVARYETGDGICHVETHGWQPYSHGSQGADSVVMAFSISDLKNKLDTGEASEISY